MNDCLTIGEALQYTLSRLPRQEARWLLEHIIQRPYSQLIIHAEQRLSVQYTQDIIQKTQRIATGEPFAYVIGESVFRDRVFSVNPAVLIPRPETQLLVDLALKQMQHIPHPRVLDLGTGSGIIAISLALEAPQADIHAADISNDALSVARQNAHYHQASITWYQSDWLNDIPDCCYDIIVANPPYIAENDPHLIDLQHEPQQALVSEKNGYHDLMTIIQSARQVLSGWLFCEHGHTQGPKCQALFRQAGYTDISSWTDMFGQLRVTGGRFQPPT